ncbi:hypothetical protein AYO20_10234 [Fonsecaea nubica]|uniref:Nephrocystin 3-like N-terminal domain-containing protein n=1 Tax=Fonsecaea nubica TaxID=856822 RepID=A0A178C832_9EURO|nr:hypothetical protein AYO20_10234 [Fonsecaea nubica]OAL26100.1 hypothetical protein AYO20_10234 [Fonsecaea nubica]
MASDESRRQSRVHPDRLQLQNTSETTEAAHALPTPETIPPAQHPLPQILDDGITELWCPSDPAQIVADIYFVHGLMGHPFKTWCHPKAAPLQYLRADTGSRRRVLSRILGRKHEAPQQTSDNTSQAAAPKGRGCYWPLDLIPNDFDNVRVLTCGYDSHPTRFLAGGNQMTISQHAQNLLQRIRTTRSGCQGRPIIFVAHSLGGILVEDAIIESRKFKHQPAVLDISCSCAAIFFFGTPHNGSDAATYGESLGKILDICGLRVNKQIMRELQRNGEKLSAVERDFNDLLNEDIPPRDKLQICSFQEGKAVTGLKFFPIGKVVEDSSSSFNRRDIETSMFINENHMGMVRFQSAQSQGYVDFRSRLTEYLHEIERTTSAQRLREQTQQAERAALMEALDFTDRCIREQQLSDLDTPEKTFTWIWDTPFKTWLENDSSIFWIYGKPASGKSTLLNYIRKAGNTRKILNNSHEKPWKIIHFFFDFRAGSAIGNNMEGFLRSLLRQLCEDLPNVSRAVPDLARIVTSNAQQQIDHSVAKPLPIDVLRTALLEGIRSCSHLIILLDGLDEYEGEQSELCNFVKALQGDKIKICLASRPDPPFPDAFAGLPSFKMEDLNFRPIKMFGLHVLEQFFSEQRYSPSILLTLADTVAQRSQGVFLWARFAIFELIKGLTRGEKLESAALMQRLEEMPPELQQIYSRIFQRCPSNERKLAGLLLLLICYGLDIVSSRMLQIAISYLPPSSSLRPDSVILLAAQGDEIEFSKRLLVVTGGTVEILKARVRVESTWWLSRVPRLIHRTVRTYLDRGGWKEILGDIYHSALGDKTWIEICARTVVDGESKMAYLQPVDPTFEWDLSPKGAGDELDQPSSTNEQPMNDLAMQALLLGHTSRNVLDHASRYEKTSATSSYPLIETLAGSFFLDLHLDPCNACQRCGGLRLLSEADKFKVELVHLAAVHDMCRFVEDVVRELQERQVTKYSKDIVDRFLEMIYPSKAHASGKALRILKKAAVKSQFSLVLALAVHDIPDSVYFLLEQCLIVEDIEITAAICYCLPRLLRLLLKYHPGDITSLKHDQFEVGLYLAWISDYPEGNVCWPLLAFAHAASVYPGTRKNYVRDAQETLVMLIDRGVQVDGTCGPLGGVLHYIARPLTHGMNITVQIIDLLVGRGVNINQLGPQGTPLELLWKLANTEKYPDKSHTYSCRMLMRALIDRGAVNTRKDPNGLVPSVIQMRLFGCNKTDEKECRRFYQVGPRDGGSVWPGPVPLHPDDGHMEDFGDVPFDEAIREYRAAMDC